MFEIEISTKNGYAMFNLDNFGTYIYQVVPTTTWFGLVTSHSESLLDPILVLPLYLHISTHICNRVTKLLLVYYNYNY